MGWCCQAANHYLSPCWPISMLPYGITRSQCVNIALCIWVITVVALTHWVRVTHVCVSRLTITGSENGWTAPSHYLNQCWIIANWTLRNKFQWNFNRNSNIFIHENAIESVVCEMAFILSRPQWVNEIKRILPIHFTLRNQCKILQNLWRYVKYR